MAKINKLGESLKELLKASSSNPAALNKLQEFLEKARKRISNEDESEDAGIPEDLTEQELNFGDSDPYADDEGDDEYGDLQEFDPDSEDPAARWLADNDPEAETQAEESQNDPDDEEDNHYEEYAPDEDEEAHQADQNMVDEESETGAPEDVEANVGQDAIAAGERGRPQGIPQEESSQGQKETKEVDARGNARFPQPTKEDIAAMRQYTRPWEQRARDKARLEAEAHKNPVLHHEGRLLEARNAAHGNKQQAYAALQASPEYKDADPITQMEMEDKFHKDFHEKNPEYFSNAMKLHGEAHSKGRGAKDIHAAAKDEQIRHVLSGGAQAEDPMSMEAAMQHAGGAKGEEGTIGSTTQDKAASFAHGNQDFLREYQKNYDKKGFKPKNIEEMGNYDEGSRADIARVLGDHPALKDPKKKSQVDAFFKQYHPLIAMNAHKVLNKLGIDPRKGGDIDLGMLHEAGMHGLMQSINDYEHDHPSKAAFHTHAGNKIRGLMQTALRGQDQIPQELRAGAKKFNQGQAAPATKPDLHAMASKHSPEVADRLKRVQTYRSVQAPKAPKPQGGGENNGNQ